MGFSYIPAFDYNNGFVSAYTPNPSPAYSNPYNGTGSGIGRYGDTFRDVGPLDQRSDYARSLRGENVDLSKYGITGGSQGSQANVNDKGFGGMFDFGALTDGTPGGTLQNTLLALQLMNSGQQGASLFSGISIGER